MRIRGERAPARRRMLRQCRRAAPCALRRDRRRAGPCDTRPSRRRRLRNAIGRRTPSGDRARVGRADGNRGGRRARGARASRPSGCALRLISVFASANSAYVGVRVRRDAKERQPVGAGARRRPDVGELRREGQARSADPFRRVRAQAPRARRGGPARRNPGRHRSGARTGRRRAARTTTRKAARSDSSASRTCAVTAPVSGATTRLRPARRLLAEHA